MGKKPYKHNSKFKFKVALESFVNGNVAEIARSYGINPNQLSNWRTELSKNVNTDLIFPVFTDFILPVF